MIEVPGGVFLMGATDEDVTFFLELCDEQTPRDERSESCHAGRYADEQPQLPIDVETFYIDRTEVSVGAYRACVDAGVCMTPSRDDDDECWLEFTWQGADDLPVNCVTWSEADSYCRWQGKRLPTAAEWEKAARGTHGGRFPWGNARPTCDQVGFSGTITPCADGVDGPEPVTSRSASASPYGVLRMADNVKEWTADWRHGVAEAESVNPAGPASGEEKVVKGGAYVASFDGMRVSRRGALAPDERNEMTGFRCVAAPEPRP